MRSNTKRIFQPLAAVLLLELLSFGAFAQIEQDLSAAAPSNAALTDVEIRDGALQISAAALAAKVSGVAVEGHVDFTISAADLSGKLLKLDAERVNALENGDFSAALDSTATPWNSGVGKWYSLTQAIANGVATLSADADDSSDNDLTITAGSNAYIAQHFEVDPGETYRLSYTIENAANLADSAFLIYLKYEGSSLGHDLTYDTPTVSGDSQLILASHDAEDEGRQHLRLNIIDSDSHLSYHDADDSALTTTFNHNPRLDSNSTTIEHAALVPDIIAGSGSVVIDDIFLDWEDQIEIEILDSGGNVVQTSNLDTGFLVDEIASGGNATVRVHLRSHKSDESPRVTALTVSDGMAMTVNVGAAVATFTKPRLGLGGAIPPHSEYDDATRSAVRTLCADFLADDGSTMNCWQLFAASGAVPYRSFMSISDVTLTWSDTLQDYEPTLSPSAQIKVDRINEAIGYGLDVNLRFHTNYTSAIDWLSRYGNANAPSRSEEELARYLIGKYAAFLAGYFDGEDDDDDAGLIDDFDIFGETNMSWSQPDWIAAADIPAFADEVAAAIQAVRPDAKIGGLGIHPNADPAFDSDYQSTLLTQLTPAYWTHTSYHPYTAFGSFTPEDAAEQWNDELSPLLNANGWQDKSVWFTEYGYNRHSYDPYCHDSDSSGSYAYDTSSTASWSRGFGLTEFGKQVARATLINLSLPVEEILYWGPFFPSDEGTCWDAHATAFMPLFDRRAGSGSISGVDEPTVYDANSGGKAFLTIANAASQSDSLLAEVSEVDGGDLADDEKYYTVALKDQNDDVVLGLWWYKTYLYGTQYSETKYMNYLYGAKDHDAENAAGSDVRAYGAYDYGFEDRRVHQVTVTGLASQVASASLVQMDGSSDSLAVSTDADGNTVIAGVAFGEEPVLVKLQFDSDGDGSINADDCDPDNAAVYPGAPELCATTHDDNCNGMVNENGAADAATYYRDDDGDAYGLDSNTVIACMRPAFHYATVGGDCDDATGSANPGRNELCDRIDNDCDGLVDEPSRYSSHTYYRDRDRDGYGNSLSPFKACSLPNGYSQRHRDCLDTNAAVSPIAPEFCGDSLDNDCDRLIDEGCPTVLVTE